MLRTVFTSARSDRPVRHILAIVLVVVIGALVAAGPSARGAPARAESQSLNMGAALRWHGWVQTDLKFSEFFSGNHTIMARFMPQYTRAYRAPILGVRRGCSLLPCPPQGPSFSLGQGDYQEKTSKKKKLVLELGGVTRTYRAPDMGPGGTWQHIALRRGPAAGGKVEFRLYLNGKLLCADPAIYATCTLKLQSPSLPIGTLQLGRTAASGASLPASKQQFYGLIDDVAVFKKVVPADQIAELADRVMHPRLTGGEADLYAGWTFDDATPTGAPLPAFLARPVTYASGAYKWPFLSQQRDNNFDDDYLPLARTELAMDLPFPTGQAWKITQGWSDTGSHYGIGAFSFDAVYQDGATKGQKVYASAAGTVAHAVDICPFPSTIPACQKNGKPGNPNVLQVRIAPGVVTSYRHLGEGSVRAAFGVPFITFGMPVATRAYIAKVGDHPNGAHLHFGVRDTADNQSWLSWVSFPVVYRNYEVWNDANGTWDFLNFGVPKKGQVVRVP
jgi:murein DD-endopeptidase MepM/ murein hydrolase activator NlpD